MSEIAVAMTTAIEPPVQKPRKTKPKPGSTRVLSTATLSRVKPGLMVSPAAL